MRRALGGQELVRAPVRGPDPRDGPRGFVGVVQTIVTNPAFTLNTLLERDKLVYLLQIMLPLAFFPLRRPVGLLCSFQGVLFTLLSTKYPPQIRSRFNTRPTGSRICSSRCWPIWPGSIGGDTPGSGGRGLEAILGGGHGGWHGGDQPPAGSRPATAHGAGRLRTYHFGMSSEDVERRANLSKLLGLVQTTEERIAQRSKEAPRITRVVRDSAPMRTNHGSRDPQQCYRQTHRVRSHTSYNHVSSLVDRDSWRYRS